MNILNFKERLTNNVFSFEQPGPGLVWSSANYPPNQSLPAALGFKPYKCEAQYIDVETIHEKLSSSNSHLKSKKIDNNQDQIQSNPTFHHQ